MGRRARGKKYNPVPEGAGGAGARAPKATNWQSAGAGYRLGGDEVPAPTRGSAKAAARNVESDGGRGNAPAGLRRVREGGDGNCLFHAIARQQLGDPDLAGRARTEICDWLQAYLVPSAIAAGRSPLSPAHVQMVQAQRAEVFAPARQESDALVLRYAQKMRRGGEWGTGLEALCAAYLYRRPVHIWNPKGASVLEPPADRRQAGVPPIRLLHNGRNHWDSALPITGTAAPSLGLSTESSVIDDAAMMEALAASIAEIEQGSNSSAALSSSAADVDETRALQRALAASAAAARIEKESLRGLSDAGRAAELRRTREKHALLGQLAERCARRGEEMPFGIGLASLEAIRVAVDARAPDVVIDGVELRRSSKPSVGNSPNESSAAGAATSDAPEPCVTRANRWGRRLRDDAASSSDPCNGVAGTAQTTQHRTDVPEDSRESCGGNIADDGEQRDFDWLDANSNTPSAEPPVLRLRLVEDGSAMEACVEALCRHGFSVDEAAEIVALCDGDVRKVSELYGIE